MKYNTILDEIRYGDRKKGIMQLKLKLRNEKNPESKDYFSKILKDLIGAKIILECENSIETRNQDCEISLEVLNNKIIYRNDFKNINQPICKSNAVGLLKEFASDLDTMELLNFMEAL